MSYRGAVEGVNDFIIANMAGFTANNCKIGDESIFAYIQSEAASDRKAVLVSPETFSPDAITEFMGASMYWSVGVNAFFMIEDSDFNTPLMDAIDFVDEFLVEITRDPTLDDSVYSAKISSGGPLMTYARGAYYYFLVPLTLRIVDNIT